MVTRQDNRSRLPGGGPELDLVQCHGLGCGLPVSSGLGHRGPCLPAVQVGGAACPDHAPLLCDLGGSLWCSVQVSAQSALLLVLPPPPPHSRRRPLGLSQPRPRLPCVHCSCLVVSVALLWPPRTVCPRPPARLRARTRLPSVLLLCHVSLGGPLPGSLQPRNEEVRGVLQESRKVCLQSEGGG